jgi:beta-lactamase superfamily II metal-dependent hydrolase
MPTIHYLNVRKGDCSLIEHASGHATVIDVCNAQKEDAVLEKVMASLASEERGVSGNFNQKKYPVNPISYLKKHGITSVFRFIATHPDMDHLDGIEVFFDTYSPANFWDTDNQEEKKFEDKSEYSEDDWLFYKKLRDTSPEHDPKRLTLYSGATGQYYNEDENGKGGGDGLHILAPTRELVSAANEANDYNDCSYVLLYKTHNHRIVFAGDSHDETWEHILGEHKSDVTNIDLLIAPHHGRASKRSYEFLDVLKPKMTFFGNANSEHLAYSAWNYRKLPFVTNNQAGCMIVDAAVHPMDLYVTHEKFARANNSSTFYSNAFKGYYYGQIT